MAKARVLKSDCDGYTSAALLLNYLYKACPSAVNRIHYDFHSGKVHGINEALIPQGTTLVIAPDSSSNDYEIHKHLHEQGIDVLVMDHHLADKISPDACIVNNQLCDYPNKSLSGVGVVYKVCEALDDLCQANYCDDLIDLVMLGLVGDMMDIRSMETRHLIERGMTHIRNPFIAGMAEKNSYSLKGELTPIGVAFYIVPYVNAITRVGTQEEKKILFESMLEWKANEEIPSTKRGCKGQMETIVEQALRICTNVKNRQTKTRDAEVEIIERIIKRDNLLNNKILIVRLPANVSIDRGVTGLIANELMSKYKRPVAILSKTENGWEGSARGYDKSQLKDFRQLCRDSQLVFLAEGHANAFGLGVTEENFDNFSAWLEDQVKDIEFSPSYMVDFIYHADDNDMVTAILALGDMKQLWGQNMDEPMIALENVAVTQDMITLMSRDKNPTIKIELPNGVSCIKFKASEEEYESLCKDTGCIRLNMVGRPEVNRYFTSITPQLLITDYEVISMQEYYF